MVSPSLPIKAGRAPSLATEANRLAVKLVHILTNSAESELKIFRKGVLDKKINDEMRLHLPWLDLPEQKRTDYVEILECVERYPFSPKTLTQWGGILADYVLFAGLERFTELKSLLKDQDENQNDLSQKRSTLQKFFRPALKLLASYYRGE